MCLIFRLTLYFFTYSFAFSLLFPQIFVRFDLVIAIPIKNRIDFRERYRRKANLAIAIVILEARSNRYPDLRTLVPKVEETLRTIKPGDAGRVR